MNCIAWNCQGLGQSMAVRSLYNLVQVTKPQVVFLSETKANRNYMASIRIKLGFTNGFHVDRVNYGGGLSLLWSDSIDVTIKSYSVGHIDAQICENGGTCWRLTGFYGNPKKENRHHSWSLLRRLSAMADFPWLCLGNFNEVMFQFEKEGIRPASISQMDSFKIAMEDCELMDMGAINGLFTWFGRRYSTDVREKIDRALVNSAWKTLFPYSTVTLQMTTASDHLPLLVSFNHTSASSLSSGNFLSRFETFWADDDECREVIDFNWHSRPQNSATHLMQAIKQTRIALKKWSSQKYGALPHTINNMRQTLHELRQSAECSQAQIKKMTDQIRELEAKEEKYWSQRSRVEWLNCGDRNTKYFHHKANSRKRQNKVSCIVDDQGVSHHSADDIARLFSEYYTALFTSHIGSSSCISDLNFKKLSASSKQFLEQPYTETEVLQALKDLPSTKAPGSDGMPILFLKKFWNIFGEDFCDCMLKFLNSGGDISGLNHTLICLIPKVKQATKVTEYRPISLCTSIYKLISRVLVNRLKRVIHEVVDESQSAFVPGRLLTDNAAIACEGFHILKSHQAGNMLP